MLAWEPGPRPEVDGVWAPWWYKTTHESTGFGPLQLKPVVPMPENIRELVEEARQGLTLVHFSAQPELFLTQNTPLPSPDTP